jgi:hypothetical protein
VLLLDNTLFDAFLLLSLFTLGDLRVVEQPPGKEVNRIARLSLVSDSHTFGNDKADIVRHQSLCL